MIKAIDVESGKYCHYQGCGRWILNQIYGEPHPENEIFTHTFDDINGTTRIKIINQTINRISFDNHAFIDEAYREFTKNRLFFQNISEIGLTLGRDSYFTLEISDTTAKPPTSRKINIVDFAFPEPNQLNDWIKIDNIIRRQIGQEKIG